MHETEALRWWLVMLPVAGYTIDGQSLERVSSAVRDDLQALRREVVSKVLEEADGSIDVFILSSERLELRIDRWYAWLTRDGIEDVSAAMIATRRLHQLLIDR